jgi:hypothetical protein
MTTPTPPALTGQDIGEAEGALRGLLDQAIADMSVSRTEYIVLRVMNARGPITPPAALTTFLAGQPQLDLTPDSAAELLAGLEARGLARGTAAAGAGPAELTPDGAALNARLGTAVAKATRNLFDGFDPGDLTIAHNVLTRLTQRAGDLRASNG